jgi:hypothetical protein
MSRDDAVALLRKLGWRVRSSGELTQVVKHFQQGWMLGEHLTEDGLIGPQTTAALEESKAGISGSGGTASRHFSFAEFACKCGGRYDDCPRIWVQAGLLRSLEALRETYYPDGLSVTSGCRCNQHNIAVGGATTSQHKYGQAADIPAHVSYRRLAADELFAGIGYNASTGLVAHVDRRDLSHNTTGAGKQNPTLWRYGR